MIDNFPKRFVIATAALTMTVFFLIISYIFGSYHAFKQVTNQTLRISKITGQIVYLDEVLTMSARMCAETGNLTWETRYRKFEPVLDAALAEAKRLAPDVYSGREAEQTDAANLSLVRMENEAFDHVRAGREDQAKRILFSDAYEAQKKIYANGMLSMTRKLEETANAKIDLEKVKVGWMLTGLTILTPLLMFGWIVTIRSLTRWQVLITGQAGELEKINFNLDQKVVDRTRAIEEVNKKLTQEIDQRKRIEFQLLQSQKMESIGTLAGGIAHDLNNQLTPVRGYIDLLLQQTEPGHENYPMLTEASLSAQRCAEVIQRLVRFSRPATENKTAFYLADLFKEFKSVIEKFLPSTIQVEFLCDESGAWPVEANETEIQTVLMNLAVNARDAMPQGGRLVIKAKNVDLNQAPANNGKVGKYVLISVTDSGSGMPPDVVKRIFDPFFTTKEKGKGTGLGLAMVFKIVTDHGGWIDVSSQVGQGTSFNIYLPAKPGAVVSAERSLTGISGYLLAKNETILLADDEEAVRNLGKTLLGHLGYKVHTASDGEEAVNFYQAGWKSIDVLLLDMTMPKMTGMQVIQKILEINPKAKIVVASGYSAEGTSNEIILRGAADFIQKPYTVVVLAQVLRKVLA